MQIDALNRDDTEFLYVSAGDLNKGNKKSLQNSTEL